ncbi:alpha/beta hydrolase [Rhodococcus sp. NPDC060086]|uniref:alpha/beta hydrolase n=1 Tax=unclassified Rhodococcus (in: high G+C Gram-positive bacteria) TaxID=192944 RepID=UPI003649A754
MRSLSYFHPDLRVAALLAPRRAVTPRTLAVMRRLTKAIKGNDPDVHVLEPGVAVRYFRPRTPMGGEPRPALLWIHGGGYVFGRAAQDDDLCQRFADRLGAVVASVDYRLAPEHPYPIPLDDCFQAYRWLVHRPEVDPTKVVIGGASAGGGLAAALAFAIRDSDLVPPVLQLLVYPMLDDRTDSGPDHMRMWDKDCNRFGWSSFLGEADPSTAAPGRRTDLAGLPPAWIGVGSNDLFALEDREYADRLAEAGVPCEFHAVAGAFHGFDSVAARSGVAREFFEKQCVAVDNVV